MTNFEEIAQEAYYGLIETNDLIKLLQLVEPIKPQVILEIGLRQALTFRAFIQAWNPAIAIGIDLEERLSLPAADSIPVIQKDGVHNLWGHDSHSDDTFFLVKSILNGRLIDFIFIDGDHSLAGVTKDWEMYGPLVRPGGIIAFHDILTLIQKEEKVEVQLLWNELIKTHKYLVINETPKEQEKLAFSSGVGIIYK